MSRSVDKERRRKARKDQTAKRLARKRAGGEGPGYDPNRPLPSGWLAVPPDVRLARVRDYHARNLAPDKRPPDADSHARLHVVVEDMIARYEPPVASGALERLLADGMRRHDAVHAIALVLTRHLDGAHGLPEAAREACERELSQLTRLRFEQWLGMR